MPKQSIDQAKAKASYYSMFFLDRNKRRRHNSAQLPITYICNINTEIIDDYNLSAAELSMAINVRTGLLRRGDDALCRSSLRYGQVDQVMIGGDHG